MSTFADSSALVKLYADEPGHEAIHELPLLVISTLARVEVVAALWRKHRLGLLTAAQVGDLVAAFETDYLGRRTEAPRFLRVRAQGGVLEAAAHAVAAHGLRAYDGVQLASALAAREADPDCATFAAFDQHLRTAAAVEGFALIPS